MAIVPEQTTLKNPSALLSIPAFPPIAVRLLQLISNENVSLREVIDLLRADPAFSAEMLRRANSALFGMASQINTLQQALVVLGLRRVRALTMTVASGMYLNSALKIEELRRCWRHTLACALLTEELAYACGVHEDVAYTAGLMHDVGRLGLLVAHPTEYANFLKRASQLAISGENFDLLDYERQVFGLDHCAAGQTLSAQWNLPQELHIIAGRHHDTPMGGPADLLTFVYLGCRLADCLGFNVVEGQHCLEFDDVFIALPAAAQHRFPSEPAELRERIEEKIRNLDNESPVPAPSSRVAVEPAAHAPVEPQAVIPVSEGSEHEAPDTFRRDIAVAVLSSTAAATIFFLLMYWFAS